MMKGYTKKFGRIIYIGLNGVQYDSDGRITHIGLNGVEHDASYAQPDVILESSEKGLTSQSEEQNKSDNQIVETKTNVMEFSYEFSDPRLQPASSSTLKKDSLLYARTKKNFFDQQIGKAKSSKVESSKAKFQPSIVNEGSPLIAEEFKKKFSDLNQSETLKTESQPTISIVKKDSTLSTPEKYLAEQENFSQPNRNLMWKKSQTKENFKPQKIEGQDTKCVSCTIV